MIKTALQIDLTDGLVFMFFFYIYITGTKESYTPLLCVKKTFFALGFHLNGFHQSDDTYTNTKIYKYSPMPNSLPNLLLHRMMDFVGNP